MAVNPLALEPLRGAFERYPFSVVDIESKAGPDPYEPGFTRPFLCGWYDGKSFLAIRGADCVPKMLATLCTSARDGHVYYAHNGGAFDWLHFLPYIKAAGWYFEILTVGSTIQMLKVRPREDSKRRGWTFLDSARLIPMTLKKAAKSFGVTLKEELDMRTHEDDSRWDAYNRIDCVALYEVLNRYHELVEITLRGEVGITAASTAMRTFRRGWQKGNIQRHVQHHALFRECYYGGRVERFASKLEGVRCYDINSSYPWSMMHPMPTGEAEEWEGKPVRGLVNNKIGFCRARVHVPENTHIPVLPYRKDGKLLFPTGKFSGSWDYLELAKAEDMGATVHYGESVWVEKSSSFREMVETLYRYRDSSLPGYDEGLAALAKLIANAFYGKFGQRTDREKIVRLFEGDEIPLGARPADPKADDCEIWYLQEEADADYVIPQIAAHVTTLSRLRLHYFFELMHSRGTLAYGDTDSIQGTGDLSDHCGTTLGLLKDEGKGELFDGQWLQPKLYRLRGNRGTDKFVMKGYRPPKELNARLDYYERVRRGETVTFESLEKIGSMAKRGFSGSPRLNQISRALKTEDEKRIMIGERTSRPLVLDE